jgi:hypothetical protein
VLNFVDDPQVNCNHRCDTSSAVTSHILLSIDGEFIAGSFEIQEPKTFPYVCVVFFLEGDVEGNTTIVKTVYQGAL